MENILATLKPAGDQPGDHTSVNMYYENCAFYNSQSTTLEARFCETRDPPQTQIEVQIFTWAGESNRCNQAHSSVAMSKEVAEEFALAIAPWLKVGK